MLVGVLWPTLQSALAHREAEQIGLTRQPSTIERPASAVLPAVPVLLDLFRTKVSILRASLNDEAVRPQAAEMLTSLIDRITVHNDAAGAPEAEIEASTARLVIFATNDNAAPRGGVVVYNGGCGDRI